MRGAPLQALQITDRVALGVLKRLAIHTSQLAAANQDSSHTQSILKLARIITGYWRSAYQASRIARSHDSTSHQPHTDEAPHPKNPLGGSNSPILTACTKALAVFRGYLNYLAQNQHDTLHRNLRDIVIEVQPRPKGYGYQQPRLNLCSTSSLGEQIETIDLVMQKTIQIYRDRRSKGPKHFASRMRSRSQPDPVELSSVPRNFAEVIDGVFEQRGESGLSLGQAYRNELHGLFTTHPQLVELDHNHIKRASDDSVNCAGILLRWLYASTTQVVGGYSGTSHKTRGRHLVAVLTDLTQATEDNRARALPGLLKAIAVLKHVVAELEDKKSKKLGPKLKLLLFMPVVQTSAHLEQNQFCDLDMLFTEVSPKFDALLAQIKASTHHKNPLRTFADRAQRTLFQDRAVHNLARAFMTCHVVTYLPFDRRPASGVGLDGEGDDGSAARSARRVGLGG